jgi:uncharacterized protein YecT (DUF1311 family)
MLPRPPVAATLLVVALIAALAPRSAATRIVYKCTNKQGDVAFQDKACAKTDRETAIDVGNAPPPPPADAPAAPAVAAAPVAPPAQPPPPPAPRKPLPPLWLCTRPEDGSHYVSRDGATPTRLVPAGILGYPPKSLAQVYGPGGGGGVSAPELNKPPTAAASGRNAIANDYVEVQDDCTPASAEQTCSYLRGELDAVDKKLHNAFKDDRARLEPQQQLLRDDLDGC